MITKTCPQKHYVWLLVLMHMHNYRTNMKHFTAMQEFAQNATQAGTPSEIGKCSVSFVLSFDCSATVDH